MINATALTLIDLGDLIDEYTIKDAGNADGSYGEIQYGALWNCCPGNEVGVIVFDNRSRHAVCQRCLNAYRGETQELPATPTVTADSPKIGYPMIRTLATIVAAIVALLTIHPAESHAQTRTTGTPTITTPAARTPASEPLMARMVNCEDYDIQPCYTYDDGAWRVVLSYKPYRAVRVVVCKAEDGGPILPCIWKRNNRVAKGQPITRNVFSRNW